VQGNFTEVRRKFAAAPGELEWRVDVISAAYMEGRAFSRRLEGQAMREIMFDCGGERLLPKVGKVRSALESFDAGIRSVQLRTLHVLSTNA
jgi:hypothetical protein